jgi:hypothetical protein
MNRPKQIFHKEDVELYKKCLHEIFKMFEEKGVTKVEIPYDDETEKDNLEIPVFNDFGGMDNKVVCAVIFTKILTINGKTMCNLAFETTDGVKHSTLDISNESLIHIYNNLYETFYN